MSKEEQAVVELTLNTMLGEIEKKQRAMDIFTVFIQQRGLQGEFEEFCSEVRMGQ